MIRSNLWKGALRSVGSFLDEFVRVVRQRAGRKSRRARPKAELSIGCKDSAVTAYTTANDSGISRQRVLQLWENEDISSCYGMEKTG